MCRELLADIHQSLRGLDERIARLERQLEAYQAADPDAQRISTLPGVGLVTSTAMTSYIAGVRAFDKARQFAASLGLTPREHSSGDQRHFGRIGKRGINYLRRLLIHGARSAMTTMLRKARRGHELTAFEQWAVATRNQVGFNKAVVELSNKLARRIFAICRDETAYQSEPSAPAAV